MSRNPAGMRTIGVTGAGGQLGKELTRLNLPELRIVGWTRDQLDIGNENQCNAIFDQIKPDAIIHAAAYTAVDRAESEPDEAWRVNVLGTRNVALAAQKIGAKFCYLSTDYVFDGTSTIPYEVNDPTAPKTRYGETKLEGERAAMESNSRTFVVRTSWIYGQYGNNFVKTMLEFASNKRELSVVHDQRGSPTYAFDLAKLLASMVLTDKYGVYHASNSGECTWYEFALAIFEESGIKDVQVHPCTTEQFPRPAPRPAYSVLGNRSLIEAGFEPMRSWREALRQYLGVNDCP